MIRRAKQRNIELEKRVGEKLEQPKKVFLRKQPKKFFLRKQPNKLAEGKSKLQIRKLKEKFP